MSIVITAASGQLGRLVVQDLLRRGVAPADIVAGARSLDSVKDLAETGVRTAVLDYGQPDTVAGAVSQGDTLVLISGNDLANRDRQHAAVIAVAAKAGAGHLVYTSGLRASESPSPIAASHTITEAAWVLRELGGLGATRTRRGGRSCGAALNGPPRATPHRGRPGRH